MELPGEETKVANLFGEEHTPIEEYEWIEECPVEGELEKLHEEILGLAEDIIEHDDALEMLGEKIQSVEDDQLQDVENLSSVVDILGCLQEANKLMLDSIVSQNEQNKILKDEINRVDNAGLYLFWFLVVWNFILTCVLCYHVF